MKKITDQGSQSGTPAGNRENISNRIANSQELSREVENHGTLDPAASHPPVGDYAVTDDGKKSNLAWPGKGESLRPPRTMDRLPRDLSRHPLIEDDNRNLISILKQSHLTKVSLLPQSLTSQYRRSGGF